MPEVLSASAAGIKLANLMGRRKSFSPEYIIKLVRLDKLKAYNRKPWLFELAELQNYVKNYSKKLNKDNRHRRYYD